MEQDAASGNNAGLLKSLDDSEERPRSAVNSVILDYYKKFGRKRDLEQYFSLSTAQSDIRDPRSLFWRRMKEQSDTSDSGEKKSESSNEICRISIRCSIPETSEAEKQNTPSNNDSESPPIITDIVPAQTPSGDESVDDNHSQKSADATLDTSMNKPLSPTSSITSQRKLEWDSLADVGYGNESEQKTSASSLSTLEREVLAQKQQYTIDFKQNSDLGIPTAHSTPVDPNDSKPKGKKGQGKKTISISRKDVDLVEVNMPHNMENVQPINVNLTKQFSVNLQKDGGMTIDNIKKDITVSPEKNVAEVETSTGVKFDKQIQTSLLRSKEKDHTPVDNTEKPSTSTQKNPILIGLNTLKRKQRRKKIRKSKIKLKSKRKHMTRKEMLAEKDKSAEQVSEAESFEYMPGHMYNQNQLKTQHQSKSTTNNNAVGNKSSLESSAVHTTDSSKESKYSFNKDLDKTLNVLKSTLKEKYDSDLKQKLIKEIIQRLLKSNYGDGEGTPEFLSILSLTSKKSPTTSTSEADNAQEKLVHSKPKKSILRVNKFDPMNVASTSQSAPNLPSAVNNDKPVMPYFSKITPSSTTETDMSNNSAKDAASSEAPSEELYKKYIEALKKEEAYKQHLKDKELFLKQKLVRSEHVKRTPLQLDLNRNTKLKELMKDLARNNYDDGSGDASKLEGGSSSNFDILRENNPRKHRSHSVFTLSSENSDIPNQSSNTKHRLLKKTANSPRAGCSNWDRNLRGSYNKPGVTDSSVQVNINAQDEISSFNPPNIDKKEKYVCLCTEKSQICPLSHHEMKVYKCPSQNPMTVSKAYCVANQPACSMHSATQIEKPVIECTRCLQTKISIHPKISDPSVSDLNIINSAECVKLIQDLYKKVSQTSSECQCSTEKIDCNSYTCKSSKDNMRRNENIERDNLIGDVIDMAPLTEQPPIEQNVIHSCVGCHKTFTNQPDSISDNIVIPIHGTNMMLKLSIGGKSMKVSDNQKPKNITCETNMSSREVETENLKTILKSSSALGDCPKSVQARSSRSLINTAFATRNIETQEKSASPREPVRCDVNNKNVEEMNPRKNNFRYLPDSVQTSGLKNTHTYPKKVQISEKKPFFRSNTDTGHLGTNSGIQTDTIYTKDKETLPCYRSEMGQGLVPKSQPKSMEGYRLQTDKETPSEQNISESSKSSTDKLHNFDKSRNKYSDEGQKSKDKKVYEDITDEGKPNDLILDVIKDITRRFSKRDTDKRSKKKCFKEIMTALSYLLDTDDSGDGDQEVSKKSQTFKGFQHTTEQGSEAELISDNLSETESKRGRHKAASSRKNSKNRTTSEDMYPHNNAKKISKSCMEMDSFKKKEARGHETVSSSMDSGRSGIKSSKSEKHETKSAIKNETTNKDACVCGCGLSDCKECMSSLSAKASNNGKIESKGRETIKSNMGCGMSSSKSEKHETKLASRKEVTSKTDCICGCGFSDCKECMTREVEIESCIIGDQSKQKTDNNRICGKETLKPGTSFNPPNVIKTCDMGCGCDGSSDCKDCADPYSPKYGTSLSCKESAETNSREAKFSSQTIGNTCDKEYGVESTSECKGFREQNNDDTEYETGKESNRPTNQESRCNTPNEIKPTCDVGCGCDGSSEECKDCVEPYTSKYKMDSCGKETSKSNYRKDTVKSKEHEGCNIPKKAKTCDKGCGCDGSSECSECGELHSLKSGSVKCGKTSARSKNQDSGISPKKIQTCDRGCGCDGSSECSDCGEPLSQKSETEKCGKNHMKSKVQDRCRSPKKTKATCDKGCGCNGSSECNQCSEAHSPRYLKGKCGKDSISCKKQDRSKSPKSPKTCDRACGCDGSSECSVCVEPHSSKYDKKSVGSKNRERSTSPKKLKTTCDKTCGCYGDSECKDCNHKTGRCGKENLRFKRQDAKKFVNKCVQSTVRRVKSLYSHCDESSDVPASTDLPCCSTDSPTSKLVHKIKKECEKYQKRKICKKCEASSSTTVSCDQCRRAEKYKCRHHKCRCHRNRSKEKIKKKCVAYNLIVQTSDSLISEEAVFDQCRKLQNVIVRVPKCKQPNIPFKEACAKIEQKLPYCDTRFEPKGRSQSWPNDCGISSTDDVKIAKACTVREYLERNRPDFINSCATRQHCIRITNQSRAKERSELREQLVGLESLPSLSNEELEYLAKQLRYGRSRPPQQKFISEREMKKHSEKIYKSLPEVTQKKENAKKESIKKTNLLMANIFKKNLQKKALSGDVNISNYNQVVKI